MTLEEFIEGAKDHEDIMDMLKKIMDLTPVLVIIVEGRNGWGPDADKDYGNILIKYRTIRIITLLSPFEWKQKPVPPQHFLKVPRLPVVALGQREELPLNVRMLHRWRQVSQVENRIYLARLWWFCFPETALICQCKNKNKKKITPSPTRSKTQTSTLTEDRFLFYWIGTDSICGHFCLHQ